MVYQHGYFKIERFWGDFMRKINDLTGQRFGHLTVLKRSERRLSGNIQWLCHCDCGNNLIVRGDNLTTGHSTQCVDCKPKGGVQSIFVKGVDEDGVV